MKLRVLVASVVVGALAATPAQAQFGSLAKKAMDAKKTVDELTFTEQEEQQLGQQISEKLRDRFGVVQDKAVHKYVTLVGTVLANASSRPNLPWTFIVLDTDGINAFAAPGGFVHITRGALGMLQNEAELADVLGHEIAHVTEKHTINAIRKSKGTSALASAATKSDLIAAAANRGYAAILENGYDRKDEMGADKVGVLLASNAGYAPNGMSGFLTRLADRNKDQKEASGLFASHPDTQARLDAMTKLIASEKIDTTATVQNRYRQSITYKSVPVGQVAQGASPTTAAAAPAPAKKEEPPKKGGLGLAALTGKGSEKSSSQSVSSAGSRGVNPDRDAKGGPNKALVAVSVTPGEVETFRKGIA